MNELLVPASQDSDAEKLHQSHRYLNGQIARKQEGRKFQVTLELSVGSDLEMIRILP